MLARVPAGVPARPPRDFRLRKELQRSLTLVMVLLGDAFPFNTLCQVLKLLLGSQLALPPWGKHIQHGHRSSAGDYCGHHSIPFIHSGSLHLDLAQLQQLRRYLCFLEL